MPAGTADASTYVQMGGQVITRGRLPLISQQVDACSSHHAVHCVRHPSKHRGTTACAPTQGMVLCTHAGGSTIVEPSKRQPAATCISSPRIPRLPACNTSGEWSQTLGCSAEEAQRLPAPATLEHLRPFLTLPSIPCLMLPGAGELEAEVGAGVSGSMGSKEQLGLAVPHVGWLQAAAPGGCRRQRLRQQGSGWLARGLATQTYRELQPFKLDKEPGSKPPMAAFTATQELLTRCTGRR